MGKVQIKECKWLIEMLHGGLTLFKPCVAYFGLCWINKIKQLIENRIVIYLTLNLNCHNLSLHFEHEAQQHPRCLHNTSSVKV